MSLLTISQITYEDISQFIIWKSIQEQLQILRDIFWIKKTIPSWIEWRLPDKTNIPEVFKVIDWNWKEWVFLKDKWIILLWNERFFDNLSIACDSTGFRYIRYEDKWKHFCFELYLNWKLNQIKDENWEDGFDNETRLAEVCRQYLTKRAFSTAVSNAIN